MNGAKVGDLVLIEWIDSASTDHWREGDDLAKWADGECICMSVGWVVRRNRVTITVAGDRGDLTPPDADGEKTRDLAGRFMQIPRGCVRKITVLRKAR